MKSAHRATLRFVLMTRSIAVWSVAAAVIACTPRSVPPTFAVVESFETGANAFVRALSIDGPSLWVASSEGVLTIERASGRLVRSYTTREGLMVDYVFAVSTDRRGTTWLGTNSGGLARVDGDRVTTFHVRDGLADPWVYHMAYQRDGTMWIGTWNGVNRFNPSNCSTSREEDGDRHSAPSAQCGLLHDPCRKDDGHPAPSAQCGFTTYRVEDGLINRWVYAVAVDRDDSVWFGTEGGISRFDGRIWKSWTHADGLGAPNAAGLKASDNTGFGTLTAGNQHRHDLTALDPEGRETYNENYVFSLLVDPQGVKWVGTWGGGVARFDGRTWTNFTTKDGLAGNVVYSIAQDPTGRLWFGTNHGLSTYDGRVWSSVPPSQRYTGGDVYAVAIDPDRSVWIGYKGGVARVRPLDRR
jgi:ligand-binding sensor domain-containing protein